MLSAAHAQACMVSAAQSQACCRQTNSSSGDLDTWVSREEAPQICDEHSFWSFCLFHKGHILLEIISLISKGCYQLTYSNNILTQFFLNTTSWKNKTKKPMVLHWLGWVKAGFIGSLEWRDVQILGDLIMVLSQDTGPWPGSSSSSQIQEDWGHACEHVTGCQLAQPFSEVHFLLLVQSRKKMQIFNSAVLLLAASGGKYSSTWRVFIKMFIHFS